SIRWPLTTSACRRTTGRVDCVPWPMLSPRGSTETQDRGRGAPQGAQAAGGAAAPAECVLVGHRVGIVSLHASDSEGFLREPPVSATPHGHPPPPRGAGAHV